MEAVKEVIKGLFSSKKFVAFIIGAVASVAAKMGLPEEHATSIASSIVMLAMTYIGGQAIADHGKEKAKVENGK